MVLFYLDFLYMCLVYTPHAKRPKIVQGRLIMDYILCIPYSIFCYFFIFKHRVRNFQFSRVALIKDTNKQTNTTYRIGKRIKSENVFPSYLPYVIPLRSILDQSQLYKSQEGLDVGNFPLRILPTWTNQTAVQAFSRNHPRNASGNIIRTWTVYHI